MNTTTQTDEETYLTEALDTTGAFKAVHHALETIHQLGPVDGVATKSGTTLVVREHDGTTTWWSFQHVAGGSLQVVKRTHDEMIGELDRIVTPLTTNTAVVSYLRALVVEVLR